MINAASMTGEPEALCGYCKRALPYGLWFARIRRGGRLLTFCRPRCLEMFLSAASPGEACDQTADDWQPLSNASLSH